MMSTEPDLEEQRVHEERGFHALARDHQEREAEDAEEGRRPGLVPRRLDAASSRPSMFFLRCAAGPPHVDDERADEGGGDQGQDALPESLIGRPGEEHASGDADDDRRQDAPAHGGNQALPAGFPQVGEADGHNEERLQALPQRHDKRLQHDDSPPTG